MNKFKLKSNFKLTADQKNAMESLLLGYKSGLQYQVLLGVTGSGKTFTMANVIEKLQMPTLIISHNKTLAAQLYQEFRDFFPKNAVSYFVSYYDYYQPEAYIPSTDTYIEKDADINELIEKLRLSTTTNLLTRKDTIVIASVSCIYNIGSPKQYEDFVFEIYPGAKLTREQIIDKLVTLQYERGDFSFHRGTFRVRGDTIDVFLAYKDEGLRIELGNKEIKNIKIINPLTGNLVSNLQPLLSNFILYPAKHYLADPVLNKQAFEEIKEDLTKRFKELNRLGKTLEAYRLKQKVTYDIEMLEQIGYVKGIENYSRYFDGRHPGEAPYCLLDFFHYPYLNNWLVFIDESHITFPQIRGMYAGDLSRKKILIDYGFRLPSSLDNRPLTFDEFMRRIPNFIATSATPAQWEISLAEEEVKRKKLKGKSRGVIEQLLRPTGIPDPQVEIRPVETQIINVIEEIKMKVKKRQRTLITTLTKKTAEDLSSYFSELGIKVAYLHSDVKTLERSDILDNLRRGKYDVLVGVNLLREGLDLPEVALVAILDADKEGFLRSEVSLIQTMGRVSRHVDGKVILYAESVTGSMKRALKEVKRRREYQLAMNKKLDIKPRSIKKPVRKKIIEEEKVTELEKLFIYKLKGLTQLPEIDVEAMTMMDKKRLTKTLRGEMKIAAQDLNFELAAEIRDKIIELEKQTI